MSKSVQALLLVVLLRLACPGEVVAQKEITDFSFLIGTWQLSTETFHVDRSAPTVGKAELVGRYVLGGKGIEITYRYRGKQPTEDFQSTATYVFNEVQQKWIGVGINSFGNPKQYSGMIKDNHLIVKQTGMLYAGRKGENKITYSKIQNDRFQSVLEHFEPKTKKWKKEFGYIAIRKGVK